MTDGVRGTTWSDYEVDAVVADYFDMLASELAASPYNKAQHRRALQQITGRAPGSIERKHQNISAVLDRLGLPRIRGYKPLANYQNALIDGIGRYLAFKGEPILRMATSTAAKLAEPEHLWIGPPPSRIGYDESETDAVKRLVLKFDPAERDARNRALGKQGEELVLKHEHMRLLSTGRDDLARKLEWTSEVRGDRAGYDIRSFNSDGSDRFVEVKTTNGTALTPFFISENERAFSDERPQSFRLVRLHDFCEKPAAFELTAPLEQWVQLAATAYRASF
jgi:hypothetical protein